MKQIKQKSPLFYIRLLLQIVTAVILFLYPFAIYFGLNYWGIQTVAPVLLIFFLLRLLMAHGKTRHLSRLIKIIALVGMALVSASWILKQNQWLLYYPVVVNVVLLSLFGYSLIKSPPIVEQLARITEPDLPASGVAYTRKVTQVWCLFFLVNGSIALFTCLSQDIALWTIYNGGISYVLIGLLMSAEWLIRIRVRR